MAHPSKRVRVDTAAVATAQYYNTTGTVPSSFQLSADLSYLITTQPNCTIAAFELPPECSEPEIQEAFARYGPVKCLQKVCNGRAALIEFPEISTPTRLVHWAKINPFFVGAFPVRLEFSSQAVTAPANFSKHSLTENIMATDTTPNNVLHLDITSAEYPITVDVLKAICSRHGSLQRIFIGKVNLDKSLEALVEFSTIEEAQQAKEHLDGADIYSGCCSLSVTFSKMKKVHVTKNDTSQWDFTDARIGLLPSAPSGQRTLLPNANGYIEHPLPPVAGANAVPSASGQLSQPPPVPPMGYQKSCYGYCPPSGQYMQPSWGYPPMVPGQPMPNYPNPAGPYGMQPPMPSPYYQHTGYQYYPQPNQQQLAPSQMHPQLQQTTVRTTPQILPTPAPVHHVTPAGIGIGHSTSNLNSTSVAAARNTDMSIFHAERGAVLMVSNLPENLDCDNLFNVLCLYGNIARIKFLKSRVGCAIVQMGSRESADLVFQHLDGATIFGRVISFHFSEQPEVQEHAGLGTLKDGSPVMKNYMADANNRFRNAVVAAKSRILAPTRTLHFFNAPLNFTPEDMCRVFSDCGVKRPPRIVVFTAKLGQKTSLGLAEWDTLGESLDALALANHRPVHIVGFAHPFHLKLAFSPKPISDDRAGQTMINYPAPPMQITRAPHLNPSGGNTSCPVSDSSPVTNTTVSASEGSAAQQPLQVGEEKPPMAKSGSPEDEERNDGSVVRDVETDKSPFDVRAVEAEEAAYLENHLPGNASNVPQKAPSSPGHHYPQPPKTPEEEDGDEAIAGGSQAPSISPRNDNEEEGNDGEEEERCVQHHIELLSSSRTSSPTFHRECSSYETPQLARKVVHQPPATPPSESSSDERGDDE